MCGEVKSKKDDKTASTPLVTISDLQRMKQFETIILRMRKQPFKTKMTPDFKIDWGKKYPKATYPTRNKEEVHTFDIKEFVKAEKKKKLLEMMNATDNDGGIPNIPNSPFSGNGLFGEIPKMPVGGMNPFNEMSHRPNKEISKIDSGVSDFNVDELVKKIDAKIAELEEEEKRNKKEQEEKKKSDNLEVIGDKESELLHTNPKEKEKPNTNITLDDDDDDDEFFDDFFDN